MGRKKENISESTSYLLSKYQNCGPMMIFWWLLFFVRSIWWHREPHRAAAKSAMVARKFTYCNDLCTWGDKTICVVKIPLIATKSAMVARTPCIATKSCYCDKKAWHKGQKLVLIAKVIVRFLEF